MVFFRVSHNLSASRPCGTDDQTYYNEASLLTYPHVYHYILALLLLQVSLTDEPSISRIHKTQERSVQSSQNHLLSYQSLGISSVLDPSHDQYLVLRLMYHDQQSMVYQHMVYVQTYVHHDQTIHCEEYMVYAQLIQYEGHIIHDHFHLSFYHGMYELHDQTIHCEEYMVYAQMIMSGQKI